METGGGQLELRKCGTRGISETEIQENGDGGNGGDAGRETEEM